MKNFWAKEWNKKYSSKEYVYGKEPNAYLKEQLNKLKAGAILFPAEGEGRNAVYAATQGWEVSAFDISNEGQQKALQLAKDNEVEINYQLGGFRDINYKPEQFDVIALIYAHFPANKRAGDFKQLERYLRKNGTFIFEVFSKNNLEYSLKNPKIGGPDNAELLYSIEDMKNYFPNYKIIELAETEIELHEGLFHNGKGSVIRFVGQKI